MKRLLLKLEGTKKGIGYVLLNKHDIKRLYGRISLTSKEYNDDLLLVKRSVMLDTLCPKNFAVLGRCVDIGNKIRYAADVKCIIDTEGGYYTASIPGSILKIKTVHITRAAMTKAGLP